MPTVSLLINTEKFVYYSFPYNVAAVLLFLAISLPGKKPTVPLPLPVKKLERG